MGCQPILALFLDSAADILVTDLAVDMHYPLVDGLDDIGSGVGTNSVVVASASFVFVVGGKWLPRAVLPAVAMPGHLPKCRGFVV